MCVWIEILEILHSLTYLSLTLRNAPSGNTFMLFLGQRKYAVCIYMIQYNVISKTSKKKVKLHVYEGMNLMHLSMMRGFNLLYTE